MRRGQLFAASAALMMVGSLSAAGAPNADLGFGAAPPREIPSDIDLANRLAESLGYGDHTYDFEVLDGEEIAYAQEQFNGAIGELSDLGGAIEMHVEPQECDSAVTEALQPTVVPDSVSEVAISETSYNGGEYEEGTKFTIVVARGEIPSDTSADAALLERCGQVKVSTSVELFGETFESESTVNIEPLVFDMGGSDQVGYVAHMVMDLKGLEDSWGMDDDSWDTDDDSWDSDDDSWDTDDDYWDSDEDDSTDALPQTTIALAKVRVGDFTVAGLMEIPPGFQQYNSPYDLLDRLDEVVTRLETPFEELTTGYYPPAGH